MCSPTSWRRLVLGAVAAVLLLSGCGGSDGGSSGASPGSASTPTGAASALPSVTLPTSNPATTSPPTPPGEPAGTPEGSVRVLRTVTTGIDVPWGLAELPDGTVLVTSRDDFHLYRLVPTTGRRSDLGVVPGVHTDVSAGGEGGLLGVAVGPDYRTDHRIYLYWSTEGDNRIGYVVFDPATHSFGAPTVIVKGIPHGTFHNGGRLAFGPDGYLYAGTGESGISDLAQEKGSLGGKVLRMTPDGDPAPGNPFGTLVYSYGHRNVQGLAFNADGRLFASEFGEKEADELNWIRPGRNYGWPQTQGATTVPGLTGPVTQFGTAEDSPSGIAIAAGCVWMAALQGQRLYRIPLDGTDLVAEPTSFLTGQLGRLRSVLALDDHTLLLSTSNRDGRATPREGDDRILLLRVT